MRNCRPLAVLVFLLVCPSAWAFEPLDAFPPRGSAGAYHSLNSAEERFTHMYEKILPELYRSMYASPGGAGICVAKLDTLKQMLRKEFENKTLSCRVALEPNGTISELRVLQTSGSTVVDTKAIKLIQDSAPFKKSEQDSVQVYKIDFPALSVHACLD